MEAKPSAHYEFVAWARNAMPWILEKPTNDSERLLASTAAIAFKAGYDAAREAAAKATQ